MPFPTLPDIHAWCASAEPVFIGGLARSGTSMLQTTLARHPALYQLADSYETHLFVRPQGAMADPPHEPTLLYLQGDRHLAAYRQLVHALQDQHPDFAEEDCIRVFFWYASHHVYPGRRPLEKTPANVRQIPRLYALFPRARLIVCSRDPVDVVASYRKRLAKSRAAGLAEERLGWLNQPIERMLEIFARYTQQVQKARATHGAAMFMAPYEWLTAAPDAALRRICEFAALPFDAAMLHAESSASTDDALATADDDDGADLTSAAPHSIDDFPDEIAARSSDAAQWLTCAEIDAIEHATQRWMPLWRSAGPLG